jgi:hypothetical protein
VGEGGVGEGGPVERGGGAGQRGGEPGESQAGAPSSGGIGQPGTGAPRPQASGEAPEADAANLEYARKQTDLVLERLSEQLQRNQVDEKLLKDLGWSEDDLRRFVERWQQRKEASRGTNPNAEAARRELDEALRSLGIRRGPTLQNQTPADQLRDLRQGYRGPVPPELQERLRAYNRGISRGGGN